MNNLIEKAIKISAIAHNNQIRKGDGLPYIVHPIAVALKLAKYNFPDAIIAAALTHDVLEDTEFSPDRLKHELGDEVLEIVRAVTNDETLSWEEKKKKYIKTVEAGGERAIAVSIADKISNLNSFLDQFEIEGSSMWKKFNRGKKEKVWFEKEVLRMARKNWQNPLLDEYAVLIKKFEELPE